MKNKYRSDLSIAKNLGSAASGSSHWWRQRFTAILMVLMTGWLFYFCWSLSGQELAGMLEVIRKPINIIILTLFTMCGFYHGSLGMQVIIEDYVHTRCMRVMLVLFIQIISIITAISFLVAVLHIMNL